MFTAFFYLRKWGVRMATEIDSLQIEINSKAEKANAAIDRLVSKLDRLTTSLSKLNTGNLTSLASGVDSLGKAMQTMNNVKTADFSSLTKNLSKLSEVSKSIGIVDTFKFSALSNSLTKLGNSAQGINNTNTSGLTKMANSISRFSNINISGLRNVAKELPNLVSSFNSMGTVTLNAQNVGNLAESISRLGSDSAQNAITTIPQLATAMSNLMTTLSKTPAVSRNIIDMTNALANLSSQGSRVGGASNSIIRGLNRASTSALKAKRSFNGFSSTIGRLYQIYFLIKRLGDGLWKSVEGTSDYLEAYNYFDVAMSKVGKDWGHQYQEYGYDSAEEYAESFSKRLQDKMKGLSGVTLEIDVEGKGILSETGLKNLGLNIQEVTQYASQLASVTNSVGQTGEVSLAAASTFTKLGADMSSLFNVDYSSVMNNLQSGLIGQSRALYKYGIDITNATLQTYAYELGLSKAVSEMTQAEKMQLRMIAILDQSKVAWGDLANTINSPSNMIRQFTNNIKEAGMILGQLFIPLLQKVLPIINGVVIAIKRLLVSIAEFFGIKIDLGSFGQGYSDLTEDIGGVSDSLDNVASSAKKAKAGLRAFDELKTINMPDTSSANSGIPGGSGIDLTDEILNATSEYEKVWQEAYDRMEDVAGQWADKFEKILAPVKKLFKDISIGDWFAVGQDVNTIATGILDFFINAIEKVDWKEVGNNIGEFIRGLDWLEIIKKAFELRFKIWEAIAEVWFGAFDAAPIETFILTSIGLLKFTGVPKMLAGKLFGGLSGQVVGESLGSKILSGLSSTWTSLGGLGGILTTDLGTIMASGSATAIGMTVATGIIGGIVAGFAGFEGGKAIGRMFAPEDFEEYYDNFKFFGDGGFFDEISDDWGITQEAISSMNKDLWDSTFFAIGDRYWSALVDPIGTLKNDLTNLGGGIAEKEWGKLSELTSDGMDDIGSIVKKKTLPIRGTWNSTFSMMNDTLEKGMNLANSKLTMKTSAMQAIWEGNNTFLKKSLKDTINTSSEVLINGLNSMNTQIGNGTSSMISKISESAVRMGSELTSQVGNIKTTMETTKGSMESLWSTTTESINKGITTSVRSMLVKTTGGLNGIIEGFEGLIRAISLGTNSLIAGVNASLGRFTSSPVKSFNPLLNIGRLTVPSFETGGYIPKSYSMFMAGENGIPEIMGTVGGKSAVAGGVEITGIKDAIYSTSQQEVQLMREQNSLLRALLEKETGISEDAIFRSVKKSASDYTKRTGRSAF